MKSITVIGVTVCHQNYGEDDDDHLHLQLHLRQTGGPGCNVCAMNSQTRYGAASDHEQDVDEDPYDYYDDADDAVGGNSGTQF